MGLQPEDGSDAHPDKANGDSGDEHGCDAGNDEGTVPAHDPVNRIGKISVEMTIVGGKIVYQK